jgi:hypothetical protein
MSTCSSPLASRHCSSLPVNLMWRTCKNCCTSYNVDINIFCLSFNLFHWVPKSSSICTTIVFYPPVFKLCRYNNNFSLKWTRFLLSWRQQQFKNRTGIWLASQRNRYIFNTTYIYRCYMYASNLLTYNFSVETIYVRSPFTHFTNFASWILCITPRCSGHTAQGLYITML